MTSVLSLGRHSWRATKQRSEQRSGCHEEESDTTGGYAGGGRARSQTILRDTAAGPCLDPAPGPRTMEKLAKVLQRVSKFKPGSLTWLDGNVKMEGRVQRRSNAEAAVICELTRVSDARVIAVCECNYERLDAGNGL